jgi:DNA-binding NarL/FixJ family response regulator
MISRLHLAIADPCTFTGYGLRTWIEMHTPHRVTAIATSVESLCTMLDDEHAHDACDVVIADLFGDDAPAPADRLAPIRHLKSSRPGAALVLFSAETDLATLMHAQLAGAAGIVSKRDDLDELIRVCDRVRRGERGVFSGKIVTLDTAAGIPTQSRDDYSAQTQTAARRPRMQLSVRHAMTRLRPTAHDPSCPARPRTYRCVAPLRIATSLLSKLRSQWKGGRYAGR